MRDFYDEDDFSIDERTGDFNIFSETYGYERKQSWEDEEENDFDDDYDDDDYDNDDYDDDDF